MANPEHLEILKQGVEVWNKWRKENPEVIPNLRGAELQKANLIKADLTKAQLVETNLDGGNFISARLFGANLSGAKINDAVLIQSDLSFAIFSCADLKKSILTSSNLLKADLKDSDPSGADFAKAYLKEANLSRAILKKATLFKADLSKAILKGANLRRANLLFANLLDVDLEGANLNEANIAGAELSYANLSRTSIVGANLSLATMVETNLSEAILSDSNVYGISAWGIKLEGIKQQKNLRVTPKDQSAVYVDNLEVAQFVYLLLHNDKIRSVIDTIGEKGVLILGRLTPERKVILDAIRNKLRELGFVPMMFDFEKPTQRDFTENIKTLAGMSRFIIADITNPKSAPLELQATMPDYMIPFVPIIDEGEEPFSMFRDLKQKYGNWVLDVLVYTSRDEVIDVMEDAVVKPALEMATKLVDAKAQDIRKRYAKDYKQ